MRVYQRELSLRTAWTVSHGTSRSRTNVFLELEDGVGEAPIVPYYPYDAASVVSWLEEVAARALPDPSESPAAFMDGLPGGPPPAREALDVALHDCWARHVGKPLHEALGLRGNGLPTSSITLSIPQDDASYVAGLQALSDWPLLKLKLGSGDHRRDLHLLGLARSHFAGDICVDANGGWDVPTALGMIMVLAEAGVRFVEQPVSSFDPGAWAALKAGLPEGAPPIIADESVQTADDVRWLSGFADGINVKLAKTGGIAGALRMIRAARETGMQVLLGCMVESSVGVTAAAHLASLADYTDLDGHLQLSNDPFRGVIVDRGVIALPESPGLGVEPTDQASA